MSLKLTMSPGQKIRLLEITDKGEQQIGTITTALEWVSGGPRIALYFDCEQWLRIVREEAYRNAKSTRHVRKNAGRVPALD
jgi:hypothetical protein